MLVKTTSRDVKETLYFSYSELDVAVTRLARIFEVDPVSGSEMYSPDFILGISRGGLIPATLLSYKTGLPMGVISIETYNNSREAHSLKINANISTTHDLSKVKSILIIDDIADSGETLMAAIRAVEYDFPIIRTATLHYKKKSIIRPTAYIEEIPDSVWIEYPWVENSNG